MLSILLPAPCLKFEQTTPEVYSRALFCDDATPGKVARAAGPLTYAKPNVGHRLRADTRRTGLRIRWCRPSPIASRASPAPNAASDVDPLPRLFRARGAVCPVGR